MVLLVILLTIMICARCRGHSSSPSGRNRNGFHRVRRHDGGGDESGDDFLDDYELNDVSKRRYRDDAGRRSRPLNTRPYRDAPDDRRTLLENEYRDDFSSDDDEDEQFVMPPPKRR